MKDWKEQLKDVKRILRDAVHDRERDENLSKVDFEPPKSRLCRGGATSKRDGEAEGAPRPASVPSKVADGEIDVRPRSVPTATGRVHRDATPGSVSQSSDHSSVPLNRTTTPPVFRPRVDAGRSLVMPAWIHTGRSLQHPSHQGGRAAPMVVRIGLDFGTAFTKVAIRAGADLVPVDWSAVTGDSSVAGRYVLPGFVRRTSNGEYCWRRCADGEIVGNLKLSVIEMAGSDECPTATLAYLALVIRYTRAFLYRDPDVGRKLVGRSLRWELNIGCPTEPHESPEVIELLRRIARTAWRMASVDDLCEPNIAAAWRSDEADVGLETEPGVVPEFVAQIAGYLGSPQVSAGLHALIDIGAATLDVATFNVVLPNNQDSSPRVPIFFSAVRRLGTHYLYHNRHYKLDLDFAWDDAAPVEPADGFAKRYGRRPNEVDTIDSEFVNKVAKCIANVIDCTRTNTRGVTEQRTRLGEYPKGSVWREGLPIFVTGGGSGCELYRRAIGAGQLDLLRRIGSSSRFRFIEMDPLGAKFPHFGTEIRGRLTVAIGLTEDAENIARVVPHRDIEPITRTVKERVDHTELYGDR